MTKLDKPLRREIEVGTKLYTVTLHEGGLKLTRKGHRRGLELHWASLAEQIDPPRGPLLMPIN